jgi:hypothetical protein
MPEHPSVTPSGLEPDTHAFVMKVWREDTARRPGWRGHIVHVASGTRSPLLRLDTIGLFVGGYLEELGVALPLWWRIRRWLANRFWR